MNILVNRIANWLAGAACICLLFLMVITFVDVVGRYFFNTPLTFAVELIELGMGLLVAFGLAITTLKGGHIAVDLVSSVASVQVNALLKRLASAAGLVFFALMTWRLWDRAVSFIGQNLFTQVLGVPVAPIVFLMAAAVAVATVIAALQLIGEAKAEESSHGSH